MAETVEPRLRVQPEPPGRTRNRRLEYERRLRMARNTAQALMALCAYIRGMFATCPPEEIAEVCDRLAAAADDERRRLRGA